jgi:hypothetical protein
VYRISIGYRNSFRSRLLRHWFAELAINELHTNGISAAGGTSPVADCWAASGDLGADGDLVEEPSRGLLGDFGLAIAIQRLIGGVASSDGSGIGIDANGRHDTTRTPYYQRSPRIHINSDGKGGCLPSSCTRCRDCPYPTVGRTLSMLHVLVVCHCAQNKLDQTGSSRLLAQGSSVNPWQAEVF